MRRVDNVHLSPLAFHSFYSMSPFPVPALVSLHQSLPSFKYSIVSIFYIVIKSMLFIQQYSDITRHIEKPADRYSEHRLQLYSRAPTPLLSSTDDVTI